MFFFLIVVVAILGFIGVTISQFIFWVWALINGKNLNINDNCPNSLLWEWLLVYGLILYTSIGYVKLFSKDSRRFSLLTQLPVVLSQFTVCWYGRQQLIEDDWCIERFYQHSIFWKTAFYMWWIQFVILSIVSIVIILGIFKNK